MIDWTVILKEIKKSEYPPSYRDERYPWYLFGSYDSSGWAWFDDKIILQCADEDAFIAALSELALNQKEERISSPEFDPINLPHSNDPTKQKIINIMGNVDRKISDPLFSPIRWLLKAELSKMFFKKSNAAEEPSEKILAIIKEKMFDFIINNDCYPTQVILPSHSEALLNRYDIIDSDDNDESYVLGMRITFSPLVTDISQIAVF